MTVDENGAVEQAWGHTVYMEDGRDSLGTYSATGIVHDAHGQEVYRTESDDWYRTQGRCVSWLCRYLNALEDAPGSRQGGEGR